MSHASRAIRPAFGDHADFYADYVRKAPEGDIVASLKTQLVTSGETFARITEEQGSYRYAAGKWSVKAVLGHLVDTEWIFGYRALRFARGDSTPLAGMDQDDYVAGARFETRTVDSLRQEFHHLRSAGIALFDSLDDEVLERRGRASECDFTVKALLYIIAGHHAHHVEVLRERYLES